MHTHHKTKPIRVHTAASQTEPDRPLSGPLHNPLVCVLLAWHLTLINYNRLNSWRPQWAAFHCLHLLTNQSSLSGHLSITEATQDVFLFEMATLWTRLNVGLREETQRVITSKVYVNLHFTRSLSGSCNAEYHYYYEV